MIRLFIILILYFINIFCSYAQSTVWFNEEFTDNQNGWPITENNEISYQIKNGKYLIHNKASNAQNSYINIFTDPEKDFILETNIIQTEGNKANGFGFIIGVNDGWLYFLIDPKESEYLLGGYKNKQWNYFASPTGKTWIVNDKIKKDSLSNKLSFARKSGKYIFKVNDVELYQTDILTNFSTISGPFGIATFTDMKLEVSNFILKQDIKINLLPKMPVGLKKINLGSNVNSQYVEKVPYISPDGKILYFNSSDNPLNTSSPDKDDIWLSEAINDTSWSMRRQIGRPLNNESHNFVISSTPDNNTLLIANTYKRDGSSKGGGVSIAHRTENGWGIPDDVIIDNYVNKSDKVNYCLSANRQALLMSVQGDDSFGGRDIYVSFLLSENHWSKPKNLGNVVNTTRFEDTPFLAADGVTLYFSSDGHPGYGSNDIFVSRRLDESWTNWSEPQNMGNSINTDAWDAYYTLPASGKYAYMTTSKNTLGGLDIVRLKIPDVAKPKAVVLIHGKVLNNKTKEPLKSIITYYDLKTHKILGTATSNPVDGTYTIVLPVGFSYSFLAKKDKFYSVTDNIVIDKSKIYTEITRDLFLAPIEIGATIRLNNIFFPIGEYTLLPDSYQELGHLVDLLNDNPNMEIVLEGHTDIIGNPSDNQLLSENRVKAVKQYLISKGINESRLNTKAYGGTKPINKNGNDEERKVNRRVEFKILKN